MMALIDSGSEKRIEPGRIFTIGYEGRTPDLFSQELKTNGIKCLIDVREIPFSRKPGFSSGKLSQHLSEKGIEYIHIKPLGSPKNIRDDLKRTGDFDSFASAYRKHLSLQVESLNVVLRSAIEKPTAIMCYERDPAQCHRGIIASELQDQGLSIRNL